jgi:diadenosine tetraphosphate (Ap4A) HIT family hydrolase
MKNCIFCDIAIEKEYATKFWENDKFFAILDLYPNTQGQSLVIPKRHFDSNVFELEEEFYLKLMSASKIVATILVNKLPVKRVAMVCEGMGINHVHVKLYPMHGLKDEFEAMLGSHLVYYEKYVGEISTLMGPKVEIETLEKMASILK